MGNTTVSEQIPILNNNINSLDKNDKINITSYSTDSVTKYETTIKKITESKDKTKFIIQCNPTYDNKYWLYKNDPNFITIYNRIIVDNTYTLVCKNELIWGLLPSINENIVDILLLDTHTLIAIIKGFLNIKEELQINDYHEIVTQDTNNKIRLLISNTKLNDIISGNTYKISYIKAWRGNLYKVTDCELQ